MAAHYFNPASSSSNEPCMLSSLPPRPDIGQPLPRCISRSLSLSMLFLGLFLILSPFWIFFPLPFYFFLSLAPCLLVSLSFTHFSLFISLFLPIFLSPSLLSWFLSLSLFFMYVSLLPFLSIFLVSFMSPFTPSFNSLFFSFFCLFFLLYHSFASFFLSLFLCLSFLY